MTANRQRRLDAIERRRLATCDAQRHIFVTRDGEPEPPATCPECGAETYHLHIHRLTQADVDELNRQRGYTP